VWPTSRTASATAGSSTIASFSAAKSLLTQRRLHVRRTEVHRLRCVHENRLETSQDELGIFRRGSNSDFSGALRVTASVVVPAPRSRHLACIASMIRSSMPTSFRPIRPSGERSKFRLAESIVVRMTLVESWARTILTISSLVRAGPAWFWAKVLHVSGEHGQNGKITTDS
jgi:hypothetical protein